MTDRRSFLKGLSGIGALSFASGTGILSALAASQAQAAEVSGYKAIVCVFLHGGQDCHDTVLPYDQASYDQYQLSRQGILNEYESQDGGSNRTRERLLPLNPDNAADFGGRQFALPDNMSALKALFDSGKAAILGNVGPLIEPMTRIEFEEQTKTAPKLLFSHNDQQSSWMSNGPEGQVVGWGGKFADAAIASGANQEKLFTSISADDINVFLSGETIQQYVLSTDGPPHVEELGEYGTGLLGTGADSVKANQLLEEHYRGVNFTSNNLIKRDVRDVTNRAFSLNKTFATALETAPTINTVFPRSRVSRQLKAVAETVNVRSALGVGRQVFFVGMGGFDTHDDQALEISAQQKKYSDGIAAFYQAMVEIGAENDVTVFTASDFGRSLLENGNGTDHGWGGHHFIVGGAVNGNHIYGDLPEPTTGHDQDAGNGRLIPQTSVEQYAATLGKWFGLSEAELAAALPNLKNFTQKDLGFMSSGAT